MSEDEPPIIPPEGEEEPKGGPEMDGEVVSEPSVPIVGDFVVRSVTRFPEDLSEREKIRKQYDGPSGSIALSEASGSIDAPPINPGRKGRGRGVDDESKR